jgi:hypothetical protein
MLSHSTRRSRLGKALLISGIVHLLAVLVVVLMGHWLFRPPLTLVYDLELDVRHHPDGQLAQKGADMDRRADRAQRPHKRPRAQEGDEGSASRRRVSARARRKPGTRTPTDRRATPRRRPTVDGQQAPGIPQQKPDDGRHPGSPYVEGERTSEAPHRLLQMRSRGTDSEQPPPEKKPRKDRFASFWAPGKAHRPEVVMQSKYRGLKMVVYEDGGRLLASSGAATRRPGAGTVGLMSLSAMTIGSASGRSACDPYRGRRPAGGRVLVVLVDTSGSITSAGRAPAAVICAAGAALAALSRGYAVGVGNFSSEFRYLHPTRDEDAIYRAVSLLQKQGTLLPAAPMLGWGRKGPRDFVLITDTAIYNLERSAPFYRRLIRKHPGNRAQLFVLGDGIVCEECVSPPTPEKRCRCKRTSSRGFDLLRAAGFVPRFVDRPGWKLKRLTGPLAQSSDPPSDSQGSPASPAP